VVVGEGVTFFAAVVVAVEEVEAESSCEDRDRTTPYLCANCTGVLDCPSGIDKSAPWDTRSDAMSCREYLHAE